MFRARLVQLLLLVVGLALLHTAVQAQYPPIQNGLAHYWPPKYASSIEPAQPRSLVGLTMVVTGDSTQWGQGNAVARLHKAEGMNVYGFSRKAKADVYNRTWEHFSGDLRIETDVISFVGWLKLRGVKQVDALILNSGVMMNLYLQDVSPINIQKGPIDTNFFGNYNMFFYLLKAGLLPHDKDIRVIWTGSIGGNTHFQPIPVYSLSKALINTFVQQSVVVEQLLGHKLKHFVLNPFGVATRISCHNQAPILVNQLCKNQTNQIYINSKCDQPFTPDQSGTTAVDVALIDRAILRNPNPEFRITVIESGFPLDAYGGKWDRWFPLWHEANSVEYAQDWLQSIIPSFYPTCASYPA